MQCEMNNQYISLDRSEPRNENTGLMSKCNADVVNSVFMFKALMLTHLSTGGERISRTEGGTWA